MEDGGGCPHDDLVVEDGMAMCTACGVVVDGLDISAQDGLEYFDAPGARPGGAGSRQQAGSQVRICERAADTAVHALGDRSVAQRARLRADVRRIADVLRMPAHVVPRLEALANATLAANPQRGFGARALEINIGALACALARQEGLPLLIAEVARACRCHAAIIGRCMARLTRTLGGAPPAEGGRPDSPAHGAGPAAAECAALGGAAQPDALADASAARPCAAPRAPASCAPLAPVVDPAALVPQIAQRLREAGAGVAPRAHEWHATCARARTLLLIARASSLVEGRHPAHLAAAAVLVAASEAGAPAPADVAAGALGIGVKTLRLRIHELVEAALRLVASLPALGATPNPQAAGGALALSACGAHPSGAAAARAKRPREPAASARRGRQRRAPGYLSAAALGLGGPASLYCSLEFICDNAQLLIGAMAAKRAAAAGPPAAAAPEPTAGRAESAAAPLTVASPPAFAVASARRLESESRVRRAEARIALARGEAPAAPRSEPASEAAGGAALAAGCDGERQLDAVDVAVERLLLGGVSPARLRNGLGTSRTADGRAALSAAARADREAERAGGSGGAGRSEGDEAELDEGDDDEEVCAMLRTAAEVEALRPLYAAL